MSQPRMICPVCEETTAITDVRAGRFRVKCPRCGAPLVLAVEVDPEVSIAAEVETKGEVISKPTSVATATPGDGGARWLGRYRLRGGWDAVRAGVGSWGRWRGVGPTVGLVTTRDRGVTDPRFLARWTLEAFGATQLRHPNLACPFAVEGAGDRIFAATSLGESTPLADLIRGGAPLDRVGKVAAVLHAARGLRLAHEQGVFHRDLNPAAIRVDAEGRVTLTGVGVGVTTGATVSTRIASISLADSPVTPVPDALNDIDALGQVLSDLVRGASGDRAAPPGLAGLIRRMGVGAESTDPDPERFRDLGAVVRALEAELGVAGPWTPVAADREAFGSAVLDYQAAPLAPLRRWIGPGALLALGLIVLPLAISGRVGASVGWLVFGALVAAASAGFRGVAARSQVAPRVAASLPVLDRRDGVALALTGFLVLVVLVLTQAVTLGIVATIVATGLAASYHFGFDRPLERSRAGALSQLRSLIRQWRQAGVAEVAIRRYVAGAGGKGWEEVFSDLFGPDAVGPSRAIWGLDLSGQPRPRFAVVRAWLVGRIDAVIVGRTLDRTRILLEPILERDLEAGGMHVLTARRKAKRAAEAVVAVARQYRSAADESVGLPLLEAFRKAVDHPEEFLLSPEIAEAAEPSRWASQARFYFETLFGRRVRFLLGATALAGALIWMEQNALVSFTQIQRLVKNASFEWDWPRALYQVREIGQRFTERVDRLVHSPTGPDPMQVRFLPVGLTSRLNGFALVASGLILLASALVGGIRIIPFALASALIPVIPWLIFAQDQPLGPIALTAMGLGAIVLAVGWWVSRE